MSADTAAAAIGMPEANVVVGQCVAYLALAPKSTAVYKAVAAVQKQGSAALVNVTHGSDARKDAVAAAGGVEAVVAGMRAHAGVAEVQKQGSWALRNVAENSSRRREAVDKAAQAAGVKWQA